MSGGVKVPGLTRRAKRDIYDHVFGSDDHEVGGVLVGVLGKGDLPTVTGSIAALEARGERASVTFTHEAWAEVHEAMERSYPGHQIVGWYHSHPGFGIFLSRHDLFIHENFFSDRRQLAYVIDPHAGTEGVFGWRSGAVQLLEECAAGRQGTRGGRAAPPPSPSSSRVPIIVLAALLGLLLGVGVELALGGDDRARTPSPTPAAETPGRGR